LFSCFDGWSDQLCICRCLRHLIVLNIFSVLCWSMYICIYLYPVFLQFTLEPHYHMSSRQYWRIIK
jgi:hypothetical protein